MRLSLPGSAIFAAALALASPASAGWDYTQWGMSPAEVVRASAGAARLTAEEPPVRILGQDVLATAPYRMAEVELQAEFLFSPLDHRLSMVRLHALDPGQCTSLLVELLGRYRSGGREAHGGAVAMQFHSVSQNNRILLTDMSGQSPPHCEILYRPIRGTGRGRSGH